MEELINNIDVIVISIVIIIGIIVGLYVLTCQSRKTCLRHTIVREYKLLITMAKTEGSVVIVEYMNYPRHILVNGSKFHKEGNNHDRLEYLKALSNLNAKGLVGEVMPGMYKLTASGVDLARYRIARYRMIE